MDWARIWTKAESRMGPVLFVGDDREASLEQAYGGPHRGTSVWEAQHNHGGTKWLWRDNLPVNVQGEGSGPRVR